MRRSNRDPGIPPSRRPAALPPSAAPRYTVCCFRHVRYTNGLHELGRELTLSFVPAPGMVFHDVFHDDDDYEVGPVHYEVRTGEFYCEEGPTDARGLPPDAVRNWELDRDEAAHYFARGIRIDGMETLRDWEELLRAYADMVPIPGVTGS